MTSMSSVAKSPAEIFDEAKALDGRLEGLNLEYDLGDAALLVKGDRRILVYLYDETSEKLKELHQQAEASGDGILVLLPQQGVPEQVLASVRNLLHFDYM